MLAFGLVGMALVQWLPLYGHLVALVGVSEQGDTWLVSSTVFVVVCAAGVAASWTRPQRGEYRHAIALVLAGATLHGALRFSLGPGQATLAGGTVLAGGAGVVVAAVGIGRGRTWGLLLLLASAALLVIGVARTPKLVVFAGSHPWFPGRGYINLRNAGLVSAALAIATGTLYVGPIVRFLRAGETRT